MKYDAIYLTLLAVVAVAFAWTTWGEVWRERRCFEAKRRGTRTKK
jgi:hypothetical protein